MASIDQDSFSRQMLIHAIIGRGTDNIDYLDRLGLVEFTGNQWNESWKFSMDKLNSMTMDELLEVYCRD